MYNISNLTAIQTRKIAVWKYWIESEKTMSLNMLGRTYAFPMLLNTLTAVSATGDRH